MTLQAGRPRKTFLRLLGVFVSSKAKVPGEEGAPGNHSDSSRKRKTHKNINKFAGLSRDWAGGKILFMCFFGSFLMGRKKQINKIPPKIPGQSRENMVYVFCSLCVFFRSPQKFRLGKRADSLWRLWKEQSTILALFGRRILGQYPAALSSPGPFVFTADFGPRARRDLLYMAVLIVTLQVTSPLLILARSP